MKRKAPIALPKEIQPVQAYPRVPADDAQRKLYEKARHCQPIIEDSH